MTVTAFERYRAFDNFFVGNNACFVSHSSNRMFVPVLEDLYMCYKLTDKYNMHANIKFFPFKPFNVLY